MADALLDGNVTDQNGAAVAGALVYVYDGRGEDGGLASLRDSMGQAITNPITSGADGYWSAYSTVDQFYTLVYWWGGRKRYVEANVQLGTLGFNTDPNLRPDLASTASGKGAALIGTPGGASVQSKLNRRYDLRYFNSALVPGATVDAGPAFQTFCDAVAAGDLESNELVGLGTYYIETPVVMTNPAGVRMTALGAGGGSSTAGPLQFRVVGNIVGLTIGSASTTYWKGPILDGLSFVDDTPGTAIGGLRLRRCNSWTLKDIYASFFGAGYGILLDGTGDAVQYGKISNLRTYKCLYGIKRTGSVTDITVIGGRLLGNYDATTQPLPSSYGIGGSGRGRWNIFGTGLNDHLVALDLTGLHYCFVRATCEQRSAIIPFGTGCIIDGSASDEGYGNLIESHFTGHTTGISIGSTQARYNRLKSTYSQCATDVSDSGTATGVGGMIGEDASDQQGSVYAVRTRTSATRRAGFKVQAIGSYDGIGLFHNTSNGLIVNDGSAGGGYIGASTASKFTIGQSIYGAPTAPSAAAAAGAFIYFNAGVVTLNQFTGKSVGDALTTAGTEVGKIATIAAVTAAQLADKTHQVNTLGKIQGRQAYDTNNNKMYFAIGTAVTSKWRPFDDMSGATDVTPA